MLSINLHLRVIAVALLGFKCTYNADFTIAFFQIKNLDLTEKAVLSNRIWPSRAESEKFLFNTAS